MAFFKQFPKIGYDFARNGITQNIVDIYRNSTILPSTLDNVVTYKYYEIRNGERPDIVSQRLYGSSQYYWTFFILNDFLHDGLAAWPMSQEDLLTYMEQEYDGWAITTNPEIVRNTDQLIIDFKNSIVGRFKLGEQIVGSISGATGTLTKKNVDMNQLVIQNTTGSFIGDPSLINTPTELVIGQTSEDSVSTYRAYRYIDAPYYYYDEGDHERRPTDNGIFILGGTPESNLGFVSNRDHLFEMNELRSKIRVVDPNFIDQFADLYEASINA